MRKAAPVETEAAFGDQPELTCRGDYVRIRRRRRDATDRLTASAAKPISSASISKYHIPAFYLARVAGRSMNWQQLRQIYSGISDSRWAVIGFCQIRRARLTVDRTGLSGRDHH
jgi:hypothetical protein